MGNEKATAAPGQTERGRTARGVVHFVAAEEARIAGKENLKSSETPEKSVAASSRASIRYETAFYDERGIHIDEPDKDDRRSETALTGLRHISALFVLLSLFSEEKIERSNFNELTNALHEVGDLGARLADATYSNVNELGEE